MFVMCCILVWLVGFWDSYSLQIDMIDYKGFGYWCGLVELFDVLDMGRVLGIDV